MGLCAGVGSSFLAIGLAFGYQAIEGSVRIPSADVGILGTKDNLACRAYSVYGAEAGINLNTAATNPACLNNRCMRNYNVSQQIFVSNQEGTGLYNRDADGQIFYNLTDAEIFPGACNHAAYYGVQGMVTNSGVLMYPGDFRADNCPGTTALNCFDILLPSDAGPNPLTNVNMGLPGTPHTLSSIGGLTPVPNVTIQAPNGPCGPSALTLHWREPNQYAGNMRGGAPSPVLGVRLWKNNAPCGACPGGNLSAGWQPVGFYPLGAGSLGVCHPVSQEDSLWFALTVVLRGPSIEPKQIETGIVGNWPNQSGFVGTNSQCMSLAPTALRIAGISARYMGRATVQVSFTTGSEAGLSGFNVQRAPNASGPWATLGEMVATRGDGSSYTVNDKVRPSLGSLLYYQVQVVMNNGATEQSGSAGVTLPLVQKKISPGEN